MLKTPIISLLFFLLVGECSAQVRDSVRIYDFDNDGSTSTIRWMDSSSYDNYRINKEFCEKWFFRDSLRVNIRWSNNCVPEILFIGEYVSPDSIHFVDFARVKQVEPKFHLGPICDAYIREKDLPQIRNFTIIPRPADFTLISYTMSFEVDTGIVWLNITTEEIPHHVRKILLQQRAGMIITVDYIKVMMGGRTGRLPSLIYYVKE